MKTQTQKNSQGLHLHKTNDRWKWMAAASAATAAAATSSQATLIEVTLANNYIDAFAGNNLYATLLGDGIPIINIAFAFYGGSATSGAAGATFKGRSPFSALGARVTAFFSNSSGAAAGARVGGNNAVSNNGQASVSGTIPIKFTDPNVNGNAVTDGTLYVTAAAQALGEGGNARVTLDKFSYNTISSGVPDSGSTLALLALGAGGVIAFRERKKKQAA